MNERRLTHDGIKDSDLVQLVRFASSSPIPGANGAMRRMARKYRNTYPQLHSAIVDSLREQGVRSARIDLLSEQPLDRETKLSLLRIEHPVLLERDPILPADVQKHLAQLVEEHKHAELLLGAGLAPIRTALFVGKPGVGKTMSARWIAKELDLPLAILDLASVMSSFLGNSGTNVRRVFDYAKNSPMILLLDEVDSVAKQRDDASEIGELKRLVTVLLQEIDAWPEGSILLAATNHPSLLDPAVWRRFEQVIDFPLPNLEALTTCALDSFDSPDTGTEVAEAIALIYQGTTLSVLKNDILSARRKALLSGQDPIEVFFMNARSRFAELPPRQRGPLAAKMALNTGLSQRSIHEITGVSRDTIRKYSKNRGNDL